MNKKCRKCGGLIDWEHIPEYRGDATNPPEPEYWRGTCWDCGKKIFVDVEPEMKGNDNE